MKNPLKRISKSANKLLIAFVAIGIATTTTLPSLAQSTANRLLPNRGAGSFPVRQPLSFSEAGGEFFIERIQTNLTARPDLESFSAQATVEVRAREMKRLRRLTRRKKRYDVKKMQILLNGSRRVTRVRAGGRNLPFTHIGSFLVIDLERNPLREGQRRRFQINYTGKVHSMSRRFSKDYHINTYKLRYTMIPRSGSVEGTAQLEIKGVKDPFMTPQLEKSLAELEKVGRLPPDTDKVKLVLTLNNEYTVDNITFDNRKPNYYHMLGGVRIDLEKPIQENETHQISMNYWGKVRRIDSNLLWDNFEPVYSIRRYPTPFLKGAY